MRHLRYSWLKLASTTTHDTYTLGPTKADAASIHWVVIKNFAKNRKTAARHEREEKERLWVERGV